MDNTNTSTIMQRSKAAFDLYSTLPLQKRALLMESIAVQLEENAEALIQTASKETNLSSSRLEAELKRTCFQLTSYAAAVRDGSWMDIRIDTAEEGRVDIRKTMVPLGPVVVFGASNFPFAYSTAGGDTACALAAGCTVVVKGHPAHPETSAAVGGLISNSLKLQGLPADVFIHLAGNSIELGQQLVLDPNTTAVGFTGSFEGGKALFDLATQRAVPIPVFAEMGSVNPVFILPQKMKLEPEKLASLLADSITQSVGQFCTNPGLLITIEGPGLETFANELSNEIRRQEPGKMLHSGIADAYQSKRNATLAQKDVVLLAGEEPAPGFGTATLARVNASRFLEQPQLQNEVFGPFSLLIVCADKDELKKVAGKLDGQLTATVMATEEDFANHDSLFPILQKFAGRFIFNGVPTGVQVVSAMHHGGPFPATTDSRFTAVGIDGIKRFARPVSFQNWPNKFLPTVLKNENDERVWRFVNGKFHQDGIQSGI